MSGWREALLTTEEMRAAEACYAGPTIELMERAGPAAIFMHDMPAHEG